VVATTASSLSYTSTTFVDTHINIINNSNNDKTRATTTTTTTKELQQLSEETILTERFSSEKFTQKLIFYGDGSCCEGVMEHFLLFYQLLKSRDTFFYHILNSLATLGVQLKGSGRERTEKMSKFYPKSFDFGFGFLRIRNSSLSLRVISEIWAHTYVSVSFFLSISRLTIRVCVRNIAQPVFVYL
jgi:hypothetical protein